MSKKSLEKNVLSHNIAPHTAEAEEVGASLAGVADNHTALVHIAADASILAEAVCLDLGIRRQ